MSKIRKWLENTCENDAFVSCTIDDEQEDNKYGGMGECSISIFDGSKVMTLSIYLPAPFVSFHRCKSKDEANVAIEKKIASFTKDFEKDIKVLRDIQGTIDEFIRMASDRFAESLIKMTTNSVERLETWKPEDEDDDD